MTHPNLNVAWGESMKVNEILTETNFEGPFDGIKNAWAERKRSKQAKALQKDRAKTIKKIAPKVFKYIVQRVDEALVRAKAENRTVDPSELIDITSETMEKVLRLDTSSHPDISNRVKQMAQLIARDPDNVRTNNDVKKAINVILGLGVKKPSTKSASPSLGQKAEVFIQSINKNHPVSQSVSIPTDANIIIQNRNGKHWFGYKEPGNNDVIRIGSPLSRQQIDVLGFDANTKNRAVIAKDKDEPIIYHVF